MGKQRQRKMGQRRRPAKVGTKKLQSVQPGQEDTAPSSPDDEPGDIRRNAPGGGGRSDSSRGDSDGVAGVIRGIPTDTLSRTPTQEHYLGTWPFTGVSTTDEVAALGEWLLQMGSRLDKTPVGLVAGVHELALATQERGWVLSSDIPSSIIAKPMLRNLLLAERTGPALVVRDTLSLISTLEEWLGEDYDRAPLLANIVHDMQALEYSTGRPILRDSSVLEGALDAATVGPMMGLEAPQFYHKVGLPLVKHTARKTPQIDPDWHRWTVTYDWLLFRVLASLTHDPLFIRWFQEERNPLTELGQRLELTPEQTVAFTLWLCCGEDEALLSERYPVWATKLPESPQLVKASRADKYIPSLRLGLVRLMEQGAVSRRAQTIYGRKSPWGLRPEELLHFTIMGAVNDLLDVAMVSFILTGSQVHWLMNETDSGYNTFLRAVITGYTQETDIQSWEQELQEAARLANPLGMVALTPKAVVE